MAAMVAPAPQKPRKKRPAQQAVAAVAPWFVYMLECAGQRIYTGVTPDVTARFAKHGAGRGGAFTRSYPPQRILAAMRCDSRGAALSTEIALKKLRRPAKLQWAAQWRWAAPADS